MSGAVCLKCGCMKRHPLDSCRACGYCPVGDNLAMAQSIVLSDGYQLGEEWKDRTDADLKEISDRIKRGDRIAFNRVEIDKLLEQRKLLDAAPPSEWVLFLAFLQIFRPVLIFFGVLGSLGFGLVLYGALRPVGRGRVDWSLFFISLLSVLWIPLVYWMLFVAFKAIGISKLSFRRIIGRVRLGAKRGTYGKAQEEKHRNE